VGIGLWISGTAGPSAPLRSGRDDTSAWVLRVCYGEFGRAEGRTADPSASLGMTQGKNVPGTRGLVAGRGVLRGGWGIGAWFCGVDAHPHSVQLAAAFLGFGGLRIALYQGSQFTDTRIFLTHLDQRLALS
jgi:hypothetical protein